jgi:hypothetical protein
VLRFQPKRDSPRERPRFASVRQRFLGFPEARRRGYYQNCELAAGSRPAARCSSMQIPVFFLGAWTVFAKNRGGWAGAGAGRLAGSAFLGFSRGEATRLLSNCELAAGSRPAARCPNMQVLGGIFLVDCFCLLLKTQHPGGRGVFLCVSLLGCCCCGPGPGPRCPGCRGCRLIPWPGIGGVLACRGRELACVDRS